MIGGIDRQAFYITRYLPSVPDQLSLNLPKGSKVVPFLGSTL